MYHDLKWTRVSEKRNELTKAYEPFQIDVLRFLASQCTDAVFLDVGANIGVYSLMMSKEPSVVEIHAFEALGSLAGELKENIAKNQLESLVTVHQTLVSSEITQKDFLVRSDYAGDGGVLETHGFTDLDHSRIETMATTTLDTTLRLRDRDVIMKIDVEGHEIEVLVGAKDILRDTQGFIQVEVLNDEAFVRVRELLESLGWFLLFRLDHDCYFSNMPGYESEGQRLELLEQALAEVIERSRSGEGMPARRRLLPGVALEISREYADRLRALGRMWR